MRKLLTVSVVFVLIILSAFSAYPTTDVSIHAKSSQNTEVIKASVNIKSDNPVVSGKFALRYDSSKALFRNISSPDFYIETSVSDDVVNIVAASKSGAGVKNSVLNLEFDRLTSGELTLNFDCADCVDATKQECSVLSTGMIVDLSENAVDTDTAIKDEVVINTASADNLIVTGDYQKLRQMMLLFVVTSALMVFIVIAKIKERNELR